MFLSQYTTYTKSVFDLKIGLLHNILLDIRLHDGSILAYTRTHTYVN